MALQPVSNRPSIFVEREVHFPIQEGGKSYLNPKSSSEVVALFSRTYVFDPLPNDLMLPPVRLSKADFLRAIETFNSRAAERNFPPIKIVKMLFIGSKALGTICPELQKARADTDIVLLCEFDPDQMEEQKLWLSMIMGEVIYDAILKEKKCTECIESHWKGGGNVRKALQNQASFSRYYCRRTGFGDLYQPTPKSGVTYTFDSLLDCTVLYNPLWDGEDLLGFAIDITDFIRSGVEKFPFSMSEEQLAHATRCLKERHFERARNEKGMRQLFKLLQEMGRGLKSIDAHTQQLTEEAFLEEYHKGNFENEVNHFLKVHFENDEKGKQLFLIHLQQFLRRKEIDISHPLFLPPHVIDLWALSLIVDHPNDSMLCLYSNQKEGIGTLYRPLFQTKFLLERLLDFEGQEEIEKLNSLFGLSPKAETLFQRALQKVVREASSLPPSLIERFIYHPQTGIRERIQLILSSRDEEEIARWSRDLEIPDQKSLSEALSTLFFNAFEEERGRLSFPLLSTLRQQWGSRPLSRHHQRRYRDFLQTLPPEKLVEISDFIWWDFEILQDPDSLLLCATLAELSPDSFFAHPLSPQWQESFLKDPKGIIPFAHALTKGSVHIRKLISFFHEVQINGLSIHEDFHAHFIRVLPSLYQNASHEDLFTLVRLYCEITKRMPEELEGFEAYLDEYSKEAGAKRTMISSLFSSNAPQLSNWILHKYFIEQKRSFLEEWWSTGLPPKQAFSFFQSQEISVEEIFQILSAKRLEETILGWLAWYIEENQNKDQRTLEKEWSLVEKAIASLPARAQRHSLMIKMKEYLHSSLMRRFDVAPLNNQGEIFIIKNLLFLSLQKQNLLSNQKDIENFYSFFKDLQKLLMIFDQKDEITWFPFYLNQLLQTYPSLKEKEILFQSEILIFLFKGHKPQFTLAKELLREWKILVRWSDPLLLAPLLESYASACVRHFADIHVQTLQNEIEASKKEIKEKYPKLVRQIKVLQELLQAEDQIMKQYFVTLTALKAQRASEPLSSELEKEYQELTKTTEERLKKNSANKERLKEMESQLDRLRALKDEVEGKEKKLNFYADHMTPFLRGLILWQGKIEEVNVDFFERNQLLLSHLSKLYDKIAQYELHSHQFTGEFLHFLAMGLSKEKIGMRVWEFFEQIVVPYMEQLALIPSTERRLPFAEIKANISNFYLSSGWDQTGLFPPVNKRIQIAQKNAFKSFQMSKEKLSRATVSKMLFYLLELEVHPLLRLLLQEDFDEIFRSLMQEIRGERDIGISTTMILFSVGKFLDVKKEGELLLEWQNSPLFQTFIQDDRIDATIRERAEASFSRSDVAWIMAWNEKQKDREYSLGIVASFLRMSSYYYDVTQQIQDFLCTNIKHGSLDSLAVVEIGAQGYLQNNDQNWIKIQQMNDFLLKFLCGEHPQLPPLIRRLNCASNLVKNHCYAAKLHSKDLINEFSRWETLLERYLLAIKKRELADEAVYLEITRVVMSINNAITFYPEKGNTIALKSWFLKKILFTFLKKISKNVDPSFKETHHYLCLWFSIVPLVVETQRKLSALDPTNQELFLEANEIRDEILKLSTELFFSYKMGKEPEYWVSQMIAFSNLFRTDFFRTNIDSEFRTWVLVQLQRVSSSKKYKDNEVLQHEVSLTKNFLENDHQIGQKKLTVERSEEKKSIETPTRRNRKKKRGS